MIKQDIGFLDKPLWFQKATNSEAGMTWKGIDGYVYRAGYKVPDKVDGLILLFLLYKSQKDGYQEIFETTRYEIAKECGFSIGAKYYARIEDSLERWKHVGIRFQGTFYDGKNYLTKSFGIIDSFHIEKENKRVRIRFSPEWLQAIKESNFYKYIDFNYYKALKRPLSRRLFEILCKNFKGRDTWEIGLVKLGQKLTIYTRKIRARGEIKEVIYPSEVLIALKPAINEINKLSLDRDLLKELKISPQDALTVDYEVHGEKIIFKKKLIKKVALTLPFLPVESIDEPNLDSLYSILKKRTKSLMVLIAEHYRKDGFEYARSNIVYANEKAAKNYSHYLKQALAEDWAKTTREEMEIEKSIMEKITREEHLKAEKRAKEELEKIIRENEKRDHFFQLPKDEQEKLLFNARSQLEKNQFFMVIKDQERVNGMILTLAINLMGNDRESVAE